MTTTVVRILASLPLAAAPALGWAHAAGGPPHQHDAASWLGFSAATVLCWAAYRWVQHSAQRRLAARRR